MLDFFKKEKPFQGLIGLGGGATGLSQHVADTGGVGPGPTNVTGGTAYSYNGNFVHIFTSSGALTVGAPNNATFEFVCIGGGGGGGIYRGGGGGSGGWVSSTSAIGSGPHTVTVGAGGEGGDKDGPYDAAGKATVGGDSAFNADTVWFTGKGGGGGGSGYQAGQDGGSGGGGCWNGGVVSGGEASQPVTPPSPSTRYGGDGGDSAPGPPKYGSGGGGGTGGAGSTGNTAGGGTGGNGRQLPTTFQCPDHPLGTSGPGGDFYVGGGGGGGSIFTPVPGQTYPNGGYGGGGSGGPGGGGAGVNGVANTGGGGGGDVAGADPTPTHHAGGDGGSGLVLVAYPTSASFPA